jgi:hypothetical protein
MNLKFFTHKYFRGGINFLKNGRSCTSFTEGLKMVEYAGVDGFNNENECGVVSGTIC